MQEKPSAIIEHVETHLGPMRRGHTFSCSTGRFHVAEFPDQPRVQVVTYVTLGLSRHVLQLPRGRSVRLELVCGAYERFSGDRIASLLFDCCVHILSTHKALLRGEVIGPRGPIMVGSHASAVYATVPVEYPELFATCNQTDPPTIMTLLVPIHDSEVNFVKRRGWREFEDLLDASNCDVFDMERKPLARDAVPIANYRKL